MTITRANDRIVLERESRHSNAKHFHANALPYSREQSEADLRAEIEFRFRYIDLPEARWLTSVDFGRTGWVHVIGHPDHGSYEWVVAFDVVDDAGLPAAAGRRLRVVASDQGYGSRIGALHDALNFLHEEGCL